MTLLTCLLLLTLCYLPAQAQVAQLPLPHYPKHETRAVWLTTYSSLDWPKHKATDHKGIAAQQEELRQVLDRLQAIHINTVLLQTRIRGSVIYPSDIEPWDACLTGTAGRSPGYDPLQFAIEECHRRGMELHAWVVCIPSFKTGSPNATLPQSVLRRHKELCVRHGDSWYLDPGRPGTASYLAGICAEITRTYDIDGIHLDYIRYPEQAAGFNDKASYRKYGGRQPKNTWRRQNITRCVSEIYHTVKALKPWVKVSSAPIGKHADLGRYSSRGWNARDAVHQDAQEWLRAGIQDLLIPMMYFKDNNFFPFAIDWQEQAQDKTVVPGLGVYMLSKEERDWPLSDVVRELHFTRTAGMGGQAFFRYAFLDQDHKGIYRYLQDCFYAFPALPMPLTAPDSCAAPEPPTHLQVVFTPQGAWLQWQPATPPQAAREVCYNLYAAAGRTPDTSQATDLMVAHTDSCRLRIDGEACLNADIRFAVTATDRYGRESQPATTTVLPLQQPAHHPRLLTHDGHTLQLPPTTAPFVVIGNLQGRIVATRKAGAQADISTLPQGWYTVRSLDKGGRNTAMGAFVK